MRKLRICTSVTLLGNGVKVLSNSCLPEAKAFSTHLRVLPVLHDHLLGLPGLRALRIFSKSWNQLCIVSSPYPDTNASFELLLLLIIMITVIIITEGKKNVHEFCFIKNNVNEFCFIHQDDWWILRSRPMTMVHVAQVASFGVLFLTSLGHSDLGQLTWHEPQGQRTVHVP